MTNKKTSTKKIINTLNEGAADKERIIESPALEDSMPSALEIEKAQPTSAQIERITKKLGFLRDRILADSKEINQLIDDLHLLMPDVETGGYFLNEGLKSLNQGLEYIKDSEKERE